MITSCLWMSSYITFECETERSALQISKFFEKEKILENIRPVPQHLIDACLKVKPQPWFAVNSFSGGSTAVEELLDWRLKNWGTSQEIVVKDLFVEMTEPEERLGQDTGEFRVKVRFEHFVESPVSLISNFIKSQINDDVRYARFILSSSRKTPSKPYSGLGGEG